MWNLSMNLIESSFDVTTAKRASAHPVFNVSYPGYVVLIIYAQTELGVSISTLIQHSASPRDVSSSRPHPLHNNSRIALATVL